MNDAANELVITGLGVVSPIGIGKEAFWNSLLAGRSGVRSIEKYATSPLPVHFGGEIVDFDAKQYVTPRKSLKVMSREIQLGFSAAQLAIADARLTPGAIDPERLGVVFGADLIYSEDSELAPAFRRSIVDGQFRGDVWGREGMAEIFPLWLLKHLPNMPACHVGIAVDARGHTNSLAHGETSSLSALAEAARVLERGHVDAVIVGGTGSRINATVWLWQRDDRMSHRADEPEKACRPFDLDRDGFVYGEGAGAFLLETRRHAEARGATILARLLSVSTATEPKRAGQPRRGDAIHRTICTALDEADLTAKDLGHVIAHGFSTIEEDEVEARVIRELLGDVPVTALKSYFGYLGAGCGAVELIAAVLSLQTGDVPGTLNYETPDPKCPVNVIADGPAKLDSQHALVLSQSTMGPAAAAVVGRA